jgi:membrane-anchored glycerophosphoryl diester phosphodiesterase (GDPDase)
MYQSVKGGFFRQAIKIWWRHWRFLLRLSFTLWFQVLVWLGLAVGGYFYRSHLTWWGVALLIWLGLSIFAVTLFGAGKNLMAVLRGQGQDRYPLLSLAYLNRGWQMLFLILGFLFLMLSTAGAIIGWLFFNLAYGVVIVALALSLWLYLSWRFSLALPLLVMRSDSFWMCLKQSWHLVNKRPNLVTINFFLGLIGLFFGWLIIPLLGVLPATSWALLSQFNLAQKLTS